MWVPNKNYKPRTGVTLISAVSESRNNFTSLKFRATSERSQRPPHPNGQGKNTHKTFGKLQGIFWSTKVTKVHVFLFQTSKKNIGKSMLCELLRPDKKTNTLWFDCLWKLGDSERPLFLEDSKIRSLSGWPSNLPEERLSGQQMGSALCVTLAIVTWTAIVAPWFSIPTHSKPINFRCQYFLSSRPFKASVLICNFQWEFYWKSDS